jgi:hypothetical protein
MILALGKLNKSIEGSELMLSLNAERLQQCIEEHEDLSSTLNFLKQILNESFTLEGNLKYELRVY